MRSCSGLRCTPVIMGALREPAQHRRRGLRPPSAAKDGPERGLAGRKLWIGVNTGPAPQCEAYAMAPLSTQAVLSVLAMIALGALGGLLVFRAAPPANVQLLT